MPRKRLTDNLSWQQLLDKVKAEAEMKPDAKFDEWFLSKENDGGFFFRSLMYARCYNIYNSINFDDRDHFICVCGREGEGKSTLAMQLACTIDPTFCIERICFKPINFIRGIKKAKKGQCFILDEGNLFLFGRQAMGLDNVIMVKLFALMRQRNLCVIINVPNFFTLDPYVRNHRVDTLIYCFRKGSFQCFIEKAIRIISREGYKYKHIAGIKTPDGKRFAGYWNNFLPKINDISVENYHKHKHDQFNEFLDEIEGLVMERDGKELIDIKEMQQIVNVSKPTIMKEIHSGRWNAKQIGNRWYIKKSDILNFDKKQTEAKDETQGIEDNISV